MSGRLDRYQVAGEQGPAEQGAWPRVGFSSSAELTEVGTIAMHRPVQSRQVDHLSKPKPTLLGNSYQPAALHRGELTNCLYRDCEVVVTSLTPARISWPRCRSIVTAGGGSGLLVNEELLRAIRTESSLALQYWFGVSEYNVWCWRKAFDVGGWKTEGSRQLHQELSEAGARKRRGKKRPENEIRRSVATRKSKGYVMPNRWANDGWKPGEIALLGSMADEDVARKIGRSCNAVRVKRQTLGIVKFRAGQPTAR